VYPAPFNLVEILIVSPFEYVVTAFIPERSSDVSSRLLWFFSLNPSAYAKLNRFIMGIIFFIPLTMIAFYESVIDTSHSVWMKRWLSGNDEGEEDRPEDRDPAVDEGTDSLGRIISKVPFDRLVKAFPNTNQVSAAWVCAVCARPN
jgi:hypothetical protein